MGNILFSKWWRRTYFELVAWLIFTSPGRVQLMPCIVWCVNKNFIPHSIRRKPTRFQRIQSESHWLEITIQKSKTARKGPTESVIECISVVTLLWFPEPCTWADWNVPLLDHCLENIRQHLICHFDLAWTPRTWRPKAKVVHADTDQWHVCRDFEGIQEWLKTRI